MMNDGNYKREVDDRRSMLAEANDVPLREKVRLTKLRIKEWYEHWDGQVYVAFSGGKDSTVLLHLVREMYPDVPAVFCNTGLEYPEIVEFVKTIENVVVLRPAMSFPQVLKHYGYPVVSKEQAQFIHEARTTKSAKLRNTRLNGNKAGRGKVSKKWHYLLTAPFPISDRCCEVMKKRPSKVYERETGRKPILGTMAMESQLRHQKYIREGCNAFVTKRPMSMPMSLWSDNDVWEYIRKNDIAYSKIYDMGEDRTGCIFCAFGCHKDNPNRFQRMSKTHPKLWAYCMNKLGLREVFDFMGIPIK